MRSSLSRASQLLNSQFAAAYAAQLVTFLTMTLFNFVLPLQVGPNFYGEFVAVFSAAFTVAAIIAPGYTLAAIREAAAYGLSMSASRRLFRFLLSVSMLCAAVMGTALIGSSFGRYVVSEVLFACVLIPVLAAAHFLDSLMTSQDRNWESLLARTLWGIGVCTLPWGLARIIPSGSSVVLGVIISYSIALILYARVLTRERPDSHQEGLRSRPLRISAMLVASLHYSAISLTSSLFIWASLLVVSGGLTRDELAGLKIAMAVPTAGVAVLPFPQIFIFSRLQRSATHSPGTSKQRGWMLIAVALLAGTAGAVVLHFLAPVLVTTAFGRGYEPAARYVETTAWMLIPQIVEQPILALLSTRHAPKSLTPYYLLAFVLGLGAPAIGMLLAGPSAIATALVVGRTLSVVVPTCVLVAGSLTPHPARLGGRA